MMPYFDSNALWLCLILALICNDFTLQPLLCTKTTLKLIVPKSVLNSEVELSKSIYKPNA